MKKKLLTLLASLILIMSSAIALEEKPSKEFNPFEEIQKMQLQMDEVFKKFHQKMISEDIFSKFSTSFANTPAMDLKDIGDKYSLKVNIPGAEKNEINITTKDGVLKIEAKTSKEKKEEKENFLKQERFSGSYMRMVTLPKDANSEKLKSNYKNGVLEIVIPKKDK